MRAFPILAVLGLISYPVLDGGDATGARHAAATPMAVQGADFEWTGRLAAGKAIEIKGVNGDVRAETTGGSEVEVRATKREGRRGDADAVTFAIVEHADGVTICAMYPDEWGEEPNECGPGRRGHMSTHDNDTQVDFVVRVPAGVDFVGRTVNGDVETESLGGNVYARTVNGGIDVAAAGYVEASTVNGSIRASMGRGDWDGDLEFHTVNGSITLELPDGLGAEVRAKTVNGALETDFPLTVQGRWGPRSLTGTIGDGGRRLDLETVNGSIRLRRGA
jgi:hypothetical protein